MPVRPDLHVEGRDDEHVIIHLLRRHGIDYDPKPWPPNFPKIKRSGDFRKVLETIHTAVPLATNSPVGFVVDANDSLAGRWASVRDRLEQFGVDVPENPNPDGFVGVSEKYKATVGVWVMPDNLVEGSLESFLRNLIDSESKLIGHAESSTDHATDIGATFAEKDRLKAVLHTWLAWQKEPGLPYGTAMKAEFFASHSDASVRFVEWFKRLYRII